MTQLAVFSYDALDNSTREFLILKEKTIKLRMVNSVVETGRDLIEAKKKCDFGTFIPWVNYAFGMSKERAAEYMRVAKEFDGIDSNLLDQFGKSALVMLSSRSMPAEVKEKAFDLAESGEKVTAETVKRLKEELQEYEHTISELNDDLHKSQCRVEELKSEIIGFQVRKPEKVVEIVEREVFPADYQDMERQKDNFKKQAQSAIQSVDEIRKDLDKERADSLKLRNEIAYERSLSHLEIGVDLIHRYVGYKWFESHDVGFVLQKKISDIIGILSCLCECPSIDTDRFSRDKLFKAGFMLIRPDDENHVIKKYDGKGVWSVHSKYENRKSFREALKVLNEDEKVILA